MIERAGGENIIKNYLRRHWFFIYLPYSTHIYPLILMGLDFYHGRIDLASWDWHSGGMESMDERGA